MAVLQRDGVLLLVTIAYAASTRDPPNEQLLAGLGAGAIVVGCAVGIRSRRRIGRVAIPPPRVESEGRGDDSGPFSHLE